MTTRTFRLLGQAYGANPVSIEAKIDGTVVYTGTVPTDSSAPPVLPDLDISLGVPMCSWTSNVDYAGTFALELTVLPSENSVEILYLTGTDANYIFVPDPNNPGKWISGGADVYGENFQEVHSDEQGEWTCSQELTDVYIDGVLTDTHSTRELPGQFYIEVLTDQVLTATIHTLAGVEPPPAP